MRRWLVAVLERVARPGDPWKYRLDPGTAVLAGSVVWDASGAACGRGARGRPCAGCREGFRRPRGNVVDDLHAEILARTEHLIGRR